MGWGRSPVEWDFQLAVYITVVALNLFAQAGYLGHGRTGFASKLSTPANCGGQHGPDVQLIQTDMGLTHT